MGRTLFYCADVKTRVSSFWGFTKRELSKNWGSPEPNVQSKIRLSLANCPKKEQCQVNGIQPFLLSRFGKISFFIVKDLGNLLFSVSRLWKISLLDCQVLWVQYRLGLHLRSTSTVLYVYPLGSTLKNKVTTSLR